MRSKSLLALVAGLALAGNTHADVMNGFWIAAQSNWGRHAGFYLSLESSSVDGGVCGLDKLRLVLAVADGKTWRYLTPTPKWEPGHAYRVKATISPRGSQLWLDGKELGRIDGGFAPWQSAMTVNSLPSWMNAPADYIVFTDDVDICQGRTRRSFNFTKQNSRPLPVVMFEPQAPRCFEWDLKLEQTLSIESTFRLVRRPELREFAPYVDRYGQCRYADWPGKVRSDEDLKKAIGDEDRRLKEWGQPKCFDRFGGYTSAGWREKGSGYYRVVKKNGFWWLVSPEGNPCFYTGLCTVPSLDWERTPVSDREFLFEWLPPKNETYKGAWGINCQGESDGNEYVCPYTPNLVSKYGADWRKKALDVTARRLKYWGFSGVGKWGGLDGLPVVPVLGSYGVPNLVNHPDVFDAEVCSEFREALRKQIEPRKSDPLVVGWSLGNEIHEIVTASEVREILGKPADTAAKRAFVARALKDIYKGDAGKMAAAWGIEGKSVEDLCAAKPKPPDADVETLRRYYADRYYSFIYHTVKRIDPNHLYFGFWIVPGWWENEEDWRLIAPHCDVIGYDLYAWDFADPLLMRLLAETAKPIFCGEFSYPAFYDGARGYGVYPVWASDDADSGERYARWVRASSTNPYCVGVMWFHYRDQPITGRGPGRGPQLVHGEHYAFGAVNVTDSPKWPLVERMRKANLSAAKWRLEAAIVRPGP